MTEWIKCSERLPEKNSRIYNVIIEKNGLRPRYESLANFFDGEWELMPSETKNDKVIYWLEFPPIPQD